MTNKKSQITKNPKQINQNPLQTHTSTILSGLQSSRPAFPRTLYHSSPYLLKSWSVWSTFPKHCACGHRTHSQLLHFGFYLKMVYRFPSKITRLLFMTYSTSAAWRIYFIMYHTTFHTKEGIQRCSPGSLSFLQQELQWCFALKFFIASSPKLAGPNTISYDLRNTVHINTGCVCSLVKMLYRSSLNPSLSLPFFSSFYHRGICQIFTNTFRQHMKNKLNLTHYIDALILKSLGILPSDFSASPRIKAEKKDKWYPLPSQKLLLNKHFVLLRFLPPIFTSACKS